MDKKFPVLKENMTVNNILPKIAKSKAFVYPVVDSDKKMLGVITLDSLKNIFITEGLTDWLLAYDIMSISPDRVNENTSLKEAVTRMNEQELEYLPVIKEDDVLAGMLEFLSIKRFISSEIIRRRKQTDF